MGGGMGGRRHGGGMGGQRGERQSRAMPIKPVKRSEFDATIKAEFAEADLDHNGLVTLQEVHAARDAKLAKLIDQRFAGVDSNHDGTISRDEFTAWQRQMGSPDAADLTVEAENDRQLDQAAAEKADGQHRWGHHGGEGAGELLVAPVDANLIVNADSNHDMALSLAEDLAWQDARFDAADSDHDGELSESEIRALRQKAVQTSP
jgi:Ca2+-binding EF-hand superfamily protein